MQNVPMNTPNEQSGSLNYDSPRSAVGGSTAAIRIVIRLEPVGFFNDVDWSGLVQRPWVCGTVLHDAQGVCNLPGTG